MDARDMARLANNITVFMCSTLELCTSPKRHTQEYLFYRVIYIFSFTCSSYIGNGDYIIN